MAQNKKARRTPAYTTDTMVVCLIVGLLLIALGVLIFLANALNMAGDVFAALRQFSRGMCGAIAIVLPVIPIWGGILVMISIQRKPSLRAFLLAVLMLILICTAATLLTFVGANSLMDYYTSILAQNSIADTMPAYLARAFDFGGRYNIGGGLLGMLLSWPLWRGMGHIGGAIVVILAAVVAFLFLIRLDVKGIAARMQQRKEARRIRQAEQEAQQRQQELIWQQEQMRIRQEQARAQEQMRQQQIHQQLQMQQMQQQPVYAPADYQTAPIVQQVQPRGKQQPPQQQHGFQPTPEELGQLDLQPMPETGRKKRGGVVSREKDENAAGIPRKRRFFDRGEKAEPAQPVQEDMPQSDWQTEPVRQTEPIRQTEPLWQEAPVQQTEPARQKTLAKQTAPVRQTAPQQPVLPSEEEPPRRRPIFRREEPEMDVPEMVYTEEPQIFTAEPEPAPQPVKPAAPARTPRAGHSATQAAPAAPVRAPINPPEEVDADFAAEAQKKPASENSFLARLRAAKREAGIDVPEEEPVRSPVPRPTARTAAGQPATVPQTAPAPQTASAWEDTPPWEEAESAQPAAPMRPVVTAKKPEGGYEPELNLKPRRSGSDEKPLFDEPVQAPYVFPTMDLLSMPKPQTGISEEEDAMRSRRLENTLQSFRVPAKVRNITHGPAISRFELELAAGIKVSKVTDLSRNISMNLEVESVRIEAPIPGKSLVGVEVPNRERTNVTLREVLDSEPMRRAKTPLTVVLGKDIAGTPILCDLARMPHLLVAGATGSGKSVCINTIINSLLYRCTPEQVRLILIDPKVVELQCYNGIPHLLIPVVSDPHKASGALAWAVGEMMDRYHRFQEAGVRSLEAYEDLPADKHEKIPRIVIIIDELADLMMTCKKEVEERICRLAQLARAAGIHLIVATQRPSTDVITGLIKANIPSRIAFKVASNVDSRTILDRIGAEHLLGKGDMLYLPMGQNAPTRVQGCFLSDPEVNRITDFIRESCPSDYDPAVLEELERLQSESDQNGGSPFPEMPQADDYIGGDGSLLTQCIEMAVNDGQVSTSLIQRRLRLGYARAGRLVDEMEKRGIVGPKDGAKPRMCLISREEFEAMRATGELD